MADIYKRFLAKVKEIYNSNPKRREPADGSDGYCDCIGLIIGAIRRIGLEWNGIHGCNWTARKEFIKLEKINSVSDLKVGEVVLKGYPKGHAKWNLPGRYRQTGKYYNGDLTDYYHAGVVYSVNPLQIKHMASKMTTDTKLDHNKNSVWKYHGQLKLLGSIEPDNSSIDIVTPNDPSLTTTNEIDPDTPSLGSVAVVVADSGSTVNLRKTPSLKGALLARVPIGTRVTIVNPGEEWASIKYGTKQGYMMAKFLDIVGDGKGKY